jgi:flagellar hook assembly protein FlgD
VVSLKIYNVSGRLVKSFSLFTPHSSLIKGVSWDGKNDSGERVSSGVYFYELKVGNKFSKTKKLLFLR